MNKRALLFFLITIVIGTASCGSTNESPDVSVTPVAKAWAGNSINAVIFRHNSITTYRKTQYVAFYDTSGHVVIAQRTLPSGEWKIKHTRFTGNIRDAHNSISIMADGEGYLHLAWNQHNNHLHYTRSTEPGSLNFQDEMSMTGNEEDHVTYPEFYRMPDGDLLFLYREGGSGNGNMVMNYYHLKTQKWTQLHDDLIDGQGKRNAYWQCAVDDKGDIHLSWVWRETPNVATNHDICYAKSEDGGKTWEKSDGTPYQLPITAATAEYARHIPQNSDLINQTSMCVDPQGHPYIATYWRKKGTDRPEYYVVYNRGKSWRISQVSHRSSSFSLAGRGTRHIPISRPQILLHGNKLLMIFRDDERGDKVSVAVSRNDPQSAPMWQIEDLGTEDVGMWEPTYDIERWKKTGILDLFVEKVVQKNAEGTAIVPPQMVKVLEWKPK